MKICKFEGCERPFRTKEYCTMHYMRYLKHGDASIVKLPRGPIAKYATMKERFMNSFECVTETGCWIWTEYNNRGYGKIAWNGKIYSAHRLSYEYFVGIIAEDKCMLHKCDVPSCVNPNHLFLGTHQDNMQDKLMKERQARGEKQRLAKLNEQQVRDIRSSGIDNAILGKKYGVLTSTIWAIKARKTWKHVS